MTLRANFLTYRPMKTDWATSVRRRSWIGMILLITAACTFTSGCNNGRQLQTDIYQRELRMQEDRIYQLEDCVDEYQAIIRGYRIEVAELKSGKSGSEEFGNKSSAPVVIQPLDGGSSNSNLEFQSPNQTFDEAPAFTPTPADEAPPFDPSVDSLPLPNEPTEEAPLYIPQSYEDTNSSPLVVLSDKKNNKEVPPSEPLLKTEPVRSQTPIGITIKIRNGSPNTSGATTITAQCRLIDEKLDLENFEGEVSLMLADPSPSGAPKRIARWDFTEDEIQQAWKLRPNKLAKQEIELPLILPEYVPTDRALEVWVRLVEASGKKRLANVEAEFLSNPLRLINVEPLALKASPKTDINPIVEQEDNPSPSLAETSSVWQKARADRLDSSYDDSGTIMRATFEAPFKK